MVEDAVILQFEEPKPVKKIDAEYDNGIIALFVVLLCLVVGITLFVKVIFPWLLKRLDNIVNRYSFKQPPVRCNKLPIEENQDSV